MGAWGMNAFDNDTALDWVDHLTDPAMIRQFLADPEKTCNDWNVDAVAHAVGEIVAAASGPAPQGLYQSQSTGLIPMIMTGLEPTEAREHVNKILGGEVYLPEEIEEALPKMSFTADERKTAADHIRNYCMGYDELSNWNSPEERKACLDATITRLENTQ